MSLNAPEHLDPAAARHMLDSLEIARRMLRGILSRCEFNFSNEVSDLHAHDGTHRTALILDLCSESLAVTVATSISITSREGIPDVFRCTLELCAQMLAAVADEYSMRFGPEGRQ